ncbi:MAG: flavin monoamine oxidase family protein, partial [Anaerolineales bacterium]
ETPFWRDAGLNGQVSISDEAAVPFTYDNSLPNSEQGILVTWPNIDADPTLADPETRRTRVLETMALYFGEQALDPIEYIETDWRGDPWTPGCVSPVGPNVLTQYGPALREPVGRIHWAGTETSDIWNGYLEGAVRAGERAAAEVLARLQS